MNNDVKDAIKKELQEVELIVDENNIKDFIYEIRGKKVMLDFDLAKIYGYETKTFNQQVKYNIDKFAGNDFMFQLTETEMDKVSRCQIGTAISWGPGSRGGRTSLPYAFTEPGIYMLMTVLKGELATKQSRALVMAFQTLKNYYIETNNLLSTSGIIELTNQVNKNTDDIKEIKFQLVKVMDNFIDSSKYKHFLIMKGKRVEADVAYQDIYLMAKHSIMIVDDYISSKTLELLKIVEPTISITILSDNVNKLSRESINDFMKDTNKAVFVFPTQKMFHDRYIFIDYGFQEEKLFHSGPSLKDAGNGIGTITEIENPWVYHQIIDKLIVEDNRTLL